jgi:hypothetical protein
MVELQDIFAAHGQGYRFNHSPCLDQLKVMCAIENSASSLHCPGGRFECVRQVGSLQKKVFYPREGTIQEIQREILSYLKLAKLDYYGSISYLHDPVRFNEFLSSLYQREWIVYCKPPFKNAGCVVEYLGRYTHRVAISNNRILKHEDGMVTFKWRDYRDKNKQKEMQVTAVEFIRRFLIHVLPAGFTRIRHYGLLSPRNKTTKLTLCKKLTNTKISNTPKVKLSALELLKKLTGKDMTRCPCCSAGHLSRASPQEEIA